MCCHQQYPFQLVLLRASRRSVLKSACKCIPTLFFMYLVKAVPQSVKNWIAAYRKYQLGSTTPVWVQINPMYQIFRNNYNFNYNLISNKVLLKVLSVRGTGDLWYTPCSFKGCDQNIKKKKILAVSNTALHSCLTWCGVF